MKISFLTSCMDRCHHLKTTYLKNIENSKPTPNIDVEFVLLNYNSKDDLNSWVDSNKFPCNFKFLVTNKPKHFSMSKTKNILGKNATGDILCWLDADNITQNGFVDYVASVYTKQPSSALRVTWSKQTSGMCGRIVCRKSDFMKIGGYDEQLTGWGYEELDFCKRLENTGVSMVEIPLPFLGKLNHSDSDRFKNYPTKLIEKLPSDHVCSQMNIKSNYINFKISEKNIGNNKFIANENRKWGEL